MTAFEIFFEERRPFFLEGNEIFDFENGGDIPYYSRRIGSAPVFPGSYNAYEISEIPKQTTIVGGTFNLVNRISADTIMNDPGNWIRNYTLQIFQGLVEFWWRAYDWRICFFQQSKKSFWKLWDQ